VVSWDILEREPVANTAEVKHILISWKELAGNFSGAGDPRGAARTREEAEQEVTMVLKMAKDGGEFEELMSTYSEDAGSARTGESYKVTPDATLVIEFKQLGMRLNVGEVGVCQSDFGYHIIKRFL
jgi:PPIC-type PPIASE domain